MSAIDYQQIVSDQQATYWKTFVRDLFWGTLKRSFIALLIFEIIFLIAAYFLYRVAIHSQNAFLFLKIIETIVVFTLYLLLGLTFGIVSGINLSLLRQIDALERGIHLIVNPLMAGVIGQMPGGQQRIEIEAFNALLESHIQRFKKASHTQFRILSLLGAFSRFFVRNTLHVLKYLLLHDFLENLRKKGETQIDAKTVEVFYREKLVKKVVNIFSEKLEIVQYGIYAIAGIFVIVPLVMLVV